MERKKQLISELNRSLIKIAWKFGPKGLDGKCCDALTLPEFIALEKAAAISDCSVREIGQPLGFSKSGATRVVNRLEKKGYVKKTRTHEDSRICCVVVTPKGEKMLSYVDGHYNKEFADLASGISGYSVEDIVGLIKVMGSAINS